MRLEHGAIKEIRNGGYLHRIGESGYRSGRSATFRSVKPDREDLPELAKRYQAVFQENGARRSVLADLLKLPIEPLEQLGAGWADEHQAYSFPMSDVSGQIIGIRLRKPNGSKFAVKGSRQGLFIPLEIGNPDRVLICEGPTDCGALLSVGFPTIGRPSCNGGVQLLEKWTRESGAKEIVVVADADQAGQQGANDLAAVLCLYVSSVRVITPKLKDAREWITAGATKHDIEKAIAEANAIRLRVKGDFHE